MTAKMKSDWTINFIMHNSHEHLSLPLMFQQETGLIKTPLYSRSSCINILKHFPSLPFPTRKMEEGMKNRAERKSKSRTTSDANICYGLNCSLRGELHKHLLFWSTRKIWIFLDYGTPTTCMTSEPAANIHEDIIHNAPVFLLRDKVTSFIGDQSTMEHRHSTF